MRALLAIVLLGTAFWRAGVDWQATIGQGYAYRLDTVGGVASATWPETHAQLVAGLQQSGVPLAWNPVGAFVMALPLALVLATAAYAVWVTRRRRAR